MRTTLFTLFTASILSLIATAAFGAAKEPAKTEHPSNVALLEEAGNWLYVHFPSNVRLYVYDKDAAGKSACNMGCDSAWPPLQPEGIDNKLGDWTIITRDDGRKQWAYKRHPVYLRYHDSREAPMGDGVGGVWHFLVP